MPVILPFSCYFRIFFRPKGESERKWGKKKKDKRATLRREAIGIEDINLLALLRPILFAKE